MKLNLALTTTAAAALSCILVTGATAKAVRGGGLPGEEQGYPGCTSGQGKRDYDRGVRITNSAFTTSWNFLGQDCGQLDRLVDIMDATAPMEPYCKTLGYLDALYANYAVEQERCFDDCRESGAVTGYALAGQFCAITQGPGAKGAPEPSLTLTICNSVEESKCESKYASEVNKNCPGAKEDPRFSQYYHDLKKACKVGGGGSGNHGNGGNGGDQDNGGNNELPPECGTPGKPSCDEICGSAGKPRC